MVEGKLADEGEDPMDIQVAIKETETGTMIELRNDRGIFATVDPEGNHGADNGSEEDGDGALQAKPPPEETEGGEEDLRIATLQEEITRLTAQTTALQDEVSGLQRGIETERQKHRELWRSSCTQLRQCDILLAERESEITELKKRIQVLETPASDDPRPPSPTRDTLGGSAFTGAESGSSVKKPVPVEKVAVRRGKAPPVDPFDG